MEFFETVHVIEELDEHTSFIFLNEVFGLEEAFGLSLLEGFITLTKEEADDFIEGKSINPEISVNTIRSRTSGMTMKEALDANK